MGGGSGSSGSDLRTEQMRTLLAMLRAAQADDLAALEDAERRAVHNKGERLRRGTMLERDRTRNSGSGGGGGSGNPPRRGGSGHDRSNGRPEPQLLQLGGGADESAQMARAEKEAARRQQRFEARQREYGAQQQYEQQAQQQAQQQQQQQYDEEKYGEDEGGHPNATELHVHPGEEWEEDSRDMTRMGDSTDWTRATYEMARTVDLEEAAAPAQGGQASAQDANRSGQSHESERSERHRRLAEDVAALQLLGAGGSGGRGGRQPDAHDQEQVRAPLQPPAPSRYADDGGTRRAQPQPQPQQQPRDQRQRPTNRGRHREPSARRSKATTTASEDWGDQQAGAYLHHPDGEDQDDQDELSHHTREEMGPPLCLEDEEQAYRYHHHQEQQEQQAQMTMAREAREARRDERREQASSNVDADIQSRVLRQLENDERGGGGDGGNGGNGGNNGEDYYDDDHNDHDGEPYDEDDDDDDEYYDSDESSEISDITSPTFATYMDPPTVCDDGSILSRGVRYAAGSRFANMTAAQVAALANRRVNDRHRADGRSVASDDENAQELLRRLGTGTSSAGAGGKGGGGGGGGGGAALLGPGPIASEAETRRLVAREEEQEQEPSLAPPSLAPPSMAGVGHGSGGHIQPPPSSREIKRQQQELVAAQQAAAAVEREVQKQQARLLEQQQQQQQKQKDEEEKEKAQVEAAIAAAERQREEDERVEAEKRRRAQEEEALRKADQEARDKARARQKERRERQRREIAERQEKQRRLEEERMQQQMQQAIDEQDMQQQQGTAEEECKDDVAPPVVTQWSISPTLLGRKERPAVKSARPARPPPNQDPTRRPGQRPAPPPGGTKGGQPPPRRPPPRRPGQPGPPGARPVPPGPGQPIQRPDRARRQTSVPRDGQQPRAPRKPGEARPGGAAPGDKNSRPMSSDKPEKNKRRSALGTLLKAKTKFKAAAANAQATGGETSPHASHSSRTARASGGAGTRPRASQRDPTRKSLLSSSAAPSSPGRRSAGRSAQRDRARPTRGMARAQSAAWKQPLREEHMEKKLNPNDDSKNLDVDNLMSTMGQDIDYIFRELSTFEGQQKKQGVEETDLPANPSPRIGGSDSSDSDEQSLIATAKIKYTLGQLSSTLKQDEKRPRSSSNADPLLIDEDGFLVQGGTQPSPDDAFGASSFAGQPNEDKNRRSKRSELLAAKRKELQGYQNQQKLRQNSLRRMRSGVNADDERDNQTLATTEVEADVRKRVMALAAGKTGKNDDEGSVGLIPSGVPDLDKGERNFSTINSDDDDDLSKIDAVEAATKKRIEMLRRVVAEKAVELSAADNKGGRGGSHHPEDDELTHKLDFVEEETMKQISRLRKRYKSTRNMET